MDDDSVNVIKEQDVGDPASNSCASNQRSPSDDRIHHLNVLHDVRNTSEDDAAAVVQQSRQHFVLKNEDEDKAIIRHVKWRQKREKNSQVQKYFKVLRGISKDDHMSSVLCSAKENGEGNFSQQHKNRSTTLYYCERHSKPRSRGKQKDPKKTRANACMAYISFAFEFLENKGLYIAITRKQLQHTGHTLGDPCEQSVSLIDENLICYIEYLLSQGKKPMEVLVLCWGWATDRGHTDFHNRQYFPTTQDIKYLSQTYRTKKRIHKGDAVSVDYLGNEVMKDSIVSKFKDYMDELRKAGRLKKHVPRCKGKEQAQSLLKQGWAQRCVWLGDDQCVCHVPSQSQPNHMWVVDLLRTTCECPASAQGGMCKHIHVGLNVAAMKNIDIATARLSVAKHLYEKDQYLADGQQISVFDKESVSTVFNCSQCTCIAASHSIDCICIQVAHLVTAACSDESLPMNNEVTCEVFPSVPVAESNDDKKKQKCKEELMEIMTWLESDDYTSHGCKEEIIQHVHRVHILIFTNKFKRTTRIRKMEPNSSYRKLVEKARNRKRAHDHSYSSCYNKSTIETPARREDDSFKKA